MRAESGVETRAAGASLSADEARALALRAQGFGATPPTHPADLLDRLGAIQLDSVNVLARSHDLVAFARVGPTPTEALHQAIYDERRGFEYWGHEASWLPIDTYRYFLHRMARYRDHLRDRGRIDASLSSEVIERIRAEGPLAASDFADTRPGRGTWWNRKPSKIVLELLFAQGDLLCAGRRSGFHRLYDLPERVLPPTVDRTDPGAPAATRSLLRRAVAALGIATGADTADYYRLAPADWRPALRALVEDGEVVELAVAGWRAPAYAWPAALAGPLTIPEHRPTFLAPFDSLIWERERTERLFGFRFRVELYVPEPKRQYGYYVLPLLARGRLGGRADLKLDRATSVLRARGLWLEGASPDEAAEALGDLAHHLGAKRIEVERVVPDAERSAVVSRVRGGSVPSVEGRKKEGDSWTTVSSD